MYKIFLKLSSFFSNLKTNRYLIIKWGIFLFRMVSCPFLVLPWIALQSFQKRFFKKPWRTARYSWRANRIWRPNLLSQKDDHGQMALKKSRVFFITATWFIVGVQGLLIYQIDFSINHHQNSFYRVSLQAKIVCSHVTSLSRHLGYSVDKSWQEKKA